MNHVRIASLVEGDGEIEAVPVLIRRVIQAIDPLLSPTISRPYRHPRASIRVEGGLEGALSAVALKYPEHSILVLIDSDDDCPCDLGTEMLFRAKKARPDLQVSVVLAHREYESWFLAAAESLSGKRNLEDGLFPPENWEQVRNAKRWLQRKTVGHGKYSPTQDQAALTQSLDLAMVRLRSRSFRKLWKEVEQIVRTPKPTLTSND